MITGGNRKKYLKLWQDMAHWFADAPRKPIPHHEKDYSDWTRDELVKTVILLRDISLELFAQQRQILTSYKKAREKQLALTRAVNNKLLADYKQANPPNRIAWCREWCDDHPTYNLTASGCSRIIARRLKQESGAPLPTGRPKKSTSAR